MARSIIHRTCCATDRLLASATRLNRASLCFSSRTDVTVISGVWVLDFAITSRSLDEVTTKSTPNLLRELDYGSLSSRERKTLASVLLQMPERDEARGARITRLREDRDLSQPQVVRGLEEQEGGHVVSLRGYQTWEAGGNIKGENLIALARYHGVDPQWIKRGDTPEPKPGDTVLNADDRERLDRIEEQLEELNRKLDKILNPPKTADPKKQRADEKAKAVASEGSTRRKAKPSTAPASRAKNR